MCVSSRLLAVVLLSVQLLRPQVAAFHTIEPGLRLRPGIVCGSGGISCPFNRRSSWGAWAARQRLGGRFKQPAPRMMAAAGGGGEGGDSAIQLPIIDLSPMMREGGGTADELEAIGAQMREACTTEGIFYVSGHGVEERKLNGALQASKSFFSLPQQEKELVTCPPGRGRGFTRGYIEMGGESGSDRLEVSVHSATKHRPHPYTLADGRRFDFCHLISRQSSAIPFTLQSFSHAPGKGGLFVWV